MTEPYSNGQGSPDNDDVSCQSARLIEMARDMMPAIAERAGKCETLRRLPEETEQAFRDAGFYRVLQPARFGGLELDYGVQTELAAEIGRGCASSAWNLSVIACHGWILGMFPEAAQRSVWDRRPDATISTSFLPRNDATVERVDGGFRVRGGWGFSSGVDYCQAAIVQGMAPREPGGTPEPLFLLLGRDEYRIDDTWHASALCGTGSNDLVIEDAFVPDGHALMIADTRGDDTPGSAVNPGYLYRLPLYAMFPYNLVGAALGASRGALDRIAGGLGARRTVTRVDLAAQQSVQLRISEAAARTDTAVSSLRSMCAEMIALARSSGAIEMQDKVRCRLALAHAARLCVEAVDAVFPLLGGRGLAAGDAVQRAWRDTHAVAQHIGLVWDVQAAIYGAVRLGQPCPDPKI